MLWLLKLVHLPPGRYHLDIYLLLLIHEHVQINCVGRLLLVHHLPAGRIDVPCGFLPAYLQLLLHGDRQVKNIEGQLFLDACAHGSL